MYACDNGVEIIKPCSRVYKLSKWHAQTRPKGQHTCLVYDCSLTPEDVEKKKVWVLQLPKKRLQ